jgi:tRNA nucleotidyltransferase (CCA-adding enzyme)
MTPHAIDPRAVPDEIVRLAARVAREGGRLLIVGGWVRDRLRGGEPRDLDVEVHGLGEAELDALLREIGPVHVVGRAFAIRRVRGIDADLSWVEPSRGKGPAFSDDDSFAHLFGEAARRRDLTINAMGFDPVSAQLFDPAGGVADLGAGRLRAVDATRFGEDPLRAFRVAQLAARLDMKPEPALLRLCAAQDLSQLAGERLMIEWTSLLLRAPRPSEALDWLDRMQQLRAFPELDALRDVPQDVRWHPEGDVLTHTKMSIDAAAALRDAHHEGALAFMFGVLCHDFGKAATTRVEPDPQGPGGQRIRSIAHERAGLGPARAFLRRMQAPKRLLGQVEILVDRHLAPAQFAKQGAGDKAYRRLVRALARAHVSPRLLEAVARADHLGRTTEDARLGRFEAGDAFLARIASLDLANGPQAAAVQGRHLVARGYAPGPEYGAILERCLEMQDATGIEDADALLDRVIGARGRSGPGRD